MTFTGVLLAIFIFFVVFALLFIMGGIYSIQKHLGIDKENKNDKPGT